ncbi:MAG: ABC1 kinase family protein [Desulfuromonas sp.]|uniref:ABC1 kinase family protein n=1 Tax=Desulfuromonas thiophila TaxID=57664 RepID=UPI0024A9F886|nr:AarF/UbiB family protein [Desulfuromonas thiophila]MDD3801839.1 AarF/UbiB family protein [Desulfuromonas thiophila]
MLPFLHLDRNLRSLRRYREILAVLVTYGFDHLVEQLNIDYYLERARRLIRRQRQQLSALERLPAEQRLRMALEELGPTFIKFGQLLSTRPDLLPASYIRELNRLQDHVAPLPWSAIEQRLTTELGAPPQSLFGTVDPTPLAAASIAQVHRARLHDGRQVALKVQRPGIEAVIATDLDILEGLAGLLENNQDRTSLVSPLQLVREFRRTLYRELDFTKEAHSLCRFRSNFAGDPHLYVPEVFWDYSSEALLTLELIDGCKIDDLDGLRRAGHDLPELARRGAQCFLTQVVHHGLFHGDPHPGNLRVLADGRICFLDFGMVGHLDDELRQQLASLLLGLFRKDTDMLAEVLLTRRPRTSEIDLPALRRDLLEFIDDYHQRPLKQIDSFKLMTEFIALMGRHHIRFPADLMLLTKALVTIEGIGRRLDPDFNLIEQIEPNVRALLKQRLSSEHLGRQTLNCLRAYLDLARSLPHDIREVLLRLNSNSFKIDLEHRGLERLIRDLDKSSNRLSFSFLIGSLIIGSSLIVQTGAGPQLFGLPALGLLGYSIAALLGLWLAIGVLSSGRL